jgi:flagellar biosynthesis regulator FlaF
MERGLPASNKITTLKVRLFVPKALWSSGAKLPRKATCVGGAIFLSSSFSCFAPAVQSFKEAFMKILSIVSLLAIAAASFAQEAKFKPMIHRIAEKFQVREAHLQTQLVSSAKTKIASASVKFLQSIGNKETPKAMESLAHQITVSAFPNVLTIAKSKDVEAVAFLVMMQASKDANADMREMLDALEATNQAKKKMRDALEAMKAKQASTTKSIKADYNTIKPWAAAPSFESAITYYMKVSYPIMRPGDTIVPKPKSNWKEDISAAIDSAKNKLDSLSDLGDEIQLRLQAYQDRYSKFMETLSNLMKKSSDTDSTIIKNLK